MATVNMAWGSTGDHPSKRWVNQPYLMEVDVDLAKAAVAKGSALAQGDVLEVLAIPAGSVVLYGGFQVMEAMTGTSTDATVDMGYTGGTVDAYVDGFDLDGAAAGDYATEDSAAYTPVRLTTADTIDILIATQTGTITGGKIRVFAHVLDISQVHTPGVARIGS